MEERQPDLFDADEPDTGTESGGVIVPMSQLTTKDQIEAARQRAEARIEAEKQLKLAALSFTNADDWVLMRAESGEAKPYLQTSGAEKLIHAFGIELEVTGDKLIAHPEDGTFEVEYTGRVRARAYDNIWYPVTGSRWSGDGFFSRGGKVRVDPGDVRKAAMTNFYNRALKTVLGLRNITLDDLKKCPSVNTDKIAQLTYQESGGGGAPGSGASTTDLLTKKHVAVAIPYKDVTNRNRWKKFAGAKGTFLREDHPTIGQKNLWLIEFSEDAQRFAADLKADNAEIAFWVVDPDGGVDE